MIVTGDQGILKVGYQQAAQLGKWQLVLDPEVMNNLDFQLSAKVKSAHDHWSTERITRLGLMLDVDVWWVWDSPEVSAPIAPGKQVSATVRGIPVIVAHF